MFKKALQYLVYGGGSIVVVYAVFFLVHAVYAPLAPLAAAVAGHFGYQVLEHKGLA